MDKGIDFAKKYAQSLVALIVALIVIFAALNFLHTRFSSNIVGNAAGKVGGLASGSSYSF